ncbi:MAG: thermonuclease family protein [Candidatus Nanohaloarchaea archaeon]
MTSFRDLEGLSGTEKVFLKVSVALITFILVTGLFYPFWTHSSWVRVIKVVDGDTVKVRQSGSLRTVRLKGIDAPETTAYNAPGEFPGVPRDSWRCLENWGYRANSFVEERIEGEMVSLIYRHGVLTVEKGRYNRLLGRIYLPGSGKNLGRLLVKKGLARSYGGKYLEEERKARNLSLGLWQCG